MGFLHKAAERIEVEVIKSTHGQTFVMWPPNLTADGGEIPPLPVGQRHARSRLWVMANRTAILNLPADPENPATGVSRHTFDIASAKWNPHTKTLVAIVNHPDNPELQFAISTSGVGCSCTQGAAGNAGPIEEGYKIMMVNSNAPEFDWFEVVTQ